MWMGCQRGIVLVALSEQIIFILDPSVWGFEEIIKRFELTTIGTNVHGIWDITEEYISFIP